MFVPILTPKLQSIERRKGGGRGGKTGTTGSGGKSTSRGGQGDFRTALGSTNTGKSTATAYGLGGGTRGQVFGTRTYGSGYPGITGPGVVGRGFPFWFWPVVWGDSAASTAYLHGTEYGDSMNSSRVGGPMVEATFISNTMNTTFHPFNASAPGAPQPEQAIQYYRSSSIVLTLDGYNNSATLDSNLNATDSPLPSAIDLKLLDCLNQTIAAAAPLIDGAGPWWSTVPSTVPLVGLAWLVWALLSFV
ncbi:hypothetical protein BU15DRAFT_91031 [Melanogaster broomeanus]|nr:hypothetical protein BU15DRAFT_91031 [Melanogaster broomeanus]